jgi:hypothetical protein
MLFKKKNQKFEASVETSSFSLYSEISLDFDFNSWLPFLTNKRIKTIL